MSTLVSVTLIIALILSILLPFGAFFDRRAEPRAL